MLIWSNIKRFKFLWCDVSVDNKVNLGNNRFLSCWMMGSGQGVKICGHVLVGQHGSFQLLVCNSSCPQGVSGMRRKEGDGGLLDREGGS